MRAGFSDLPSMKNQDLFSARDRRQPMAIEVLAVNPLPHTHGVVGILTR
jgi:hypothetical protein